MPFELSLSEKQIPRFVGNVSSYRKWMELLESRVVRPRQARYQAALRPDMKYVKIIKDFPTELLLHLTDFASMERDSLIVHTLQV
jgi:hypothetical protein